MQTIRMPVVELTKPPRKRGGKPRIQREVDAAALASALRLAGEVSKIEHAFVEAVNAHPDQGVVSMFNFGQAVGIVKGILAALSIRVTFVQPRVWKQVFRLNADKEGSRKRAGELFPRAADQWRFKKDADRAEAALIAEFGRRQLVAQGRNP